MKLKNERMTNEIKHLEMNRFFNPQCSISLVIRSFFNFISHWALDISDQ